MKYVFIVNPTSGKGKAEAKILPKLNAYFAAHPEMNCEVYVTKSRGDGRSFVESIAKTGEPVRFYACGGDGTLYEVVNGAYKYPNAAVGIIPLGSGNDFARVFGGSPKLFDIDAQVNAPTRKFDLIDAGGHVAINQCSMGLDAEVCAKQAYFKKLPRVGGEFAYTMSLFYCLFRRLKSDFRIEVDDGKKTVEGTMLFALCGNARWYGGGYKGAPEAIPDDRLLDFVMVRKTVGRLKLAGLVGKYKRGEHLGWDFTEFVRGKKMHIESKKPAAVNVDGECEYVRESTFQLLPAAIDIVMPDPAAYEKTVGTAQTASCENAINR